MDQANAILTEAEYDAALARVTVLTDDLTEPGGQVDDPHHPSRVELDLLIPIIQAYEDLHHPIEQPDAVAAGEP